MVVQVLMCVLIFVIGIIVGKLWDGRFDLTVRTVQSEKPKETEEEGYGFVPEQDKDDL